MNFLFLGCEGLFADVVFLLDGSGSISAKDFENMKDIMKLVIDKFEIGLDKEHVAVVQYGTDPKEEFSLNTFNDKAVLLQEIRNIKQMNGKANTGKALKEVLQSFDISKGGRCSALKFLIVLTDGESSDDVAEPTQLIDIIFLVDAGSSNKDGFQEMINLMKYVVSKSVVGEKRVRFGGITYSDNPRLEFTLKQYDRQIDILRVISNLKASGGSRNTVQALNYALSYFGETHGGRPAENVPQVLFLITDGPVNDLSGLATWLESLAKSNVIFFAIGTEDADVEQLKEMVGYEGTAHYAKTYQDLCGLQKQNTVADIVFLVDGSNSIGPANFQQIREFLSSLVENFEVAPDRIRIGLVQYSDTPYTEFSLSTYQNKEEILSYIKNLRYKTGGTFTGKGLEFMLKQHFVEKAGSRAQQNVPQIAIVITDGDSQDEVKSQPVAKPLSSLLTYIQGIF
uniref:Si:ch211-62a1.3 n=1 Tax=Sinocyclocheilus grahami TaxID=75366 RepID=A0A672RPJ1_SINGR